MTTECTECKGWDHESCSIRKNGKVYCRKCVKEHFPDRYCNNCSGILVENDCVELAKNIGKNEINPWWKCLDCNKSFILNETMCEKHHPVKNPKHYKGNKFEVIDIIEDFNLGFNLGNAIKYIMRAGKKDSKKQDLQKAIWYIQREIDKSNEQTKQ